jgi:hypothetical protein
MQSDRARFHTVAIVWAKACSSHVASYLCAKIRWTSLVTRAVTAQHRCRLRYPPSLEQPPKNTADAKTVAEASRRLMSVPFTCLPYVSSAAAVTK